LSSINPSFKVFESFSGQKVDVLFSGYLFFTLLLHSKPMADEMAAIPRMIYGTAWKKVLRLAYGLAPPCCHTLTSVIHLLRPSGCNDDLAAYIRNGQQRW
jgi:hypothetical protein